ncbi:histidine kinase [Kordiimonas sp. SCSIO 12603]|uniref:sensor histidine kinase n=1 Tax=Kordiimonas sp. SCSIO 12603 TaxID=2829596 RepID=UPI002102FD84|nr:ATP-binding protein [Kordiimonas sp. SCSIO 12603]UTW57429.1 histidine kinase [Kordiimonas sp. SCSIO 12603]
MAYSNFTIHLGIRLTLVFISFSVFAFLIHTPGYHATTLLLLLISIGLTYNLWHLITLTNRELARFLTAIHHQDFNQRFDLKGYRSSFDDLTKSFSIILNKFKELQSNQEATLKHHKALIEHVPFPLISLHENDRVTFWNLAARKLFRNIHLSSISDLKQFGQDVYTEILSLKTGQKKLIRFNIDGTDQHFMIAATKIIIGGNSERLLSLQNIQNELETAQLQAWQDLVRVLTHEIMNSITPVASLANTANDLMEDLKGKPGLPNEFTESLTDIGDAVQTVARRSEGLTEFVGSYRQLTRLPPPQKTKFSVTELFQSIEKLAVQSWNNKDIRFESHVSQQNLELFADRKMIEQTLLNMMQNSEHAVAGRKKGHISLKAYINSRNSIVIELADNGTGIDAETAPKIFIPFYTTKRTGSGVGLALARQIMIAHRGSISHSDAENGGSVFTLTF